MNPLLVNLLVEAARPAALLLLEVEGVDPGPAAQLDRAAAEVKAGEAARAEEAAEGGHQPGLISHAEVKGPAGDVEAAEAEGGVGGEGGKAKVEGVGGEAEGQAGEVEGDEAEVGGEAEAERKGPADRGGGEEAMQGEEAEGGVGQEGVGQAEEVLGGRQAGCEGGQPGGEEGGEGERSPAGGAGQGTGQVVRGSSQRGGSQGEGEQEGAVVQAGELVRWAGGMWTTWRPGAPRTPLQLSARSKADRPGTRCRNSFGVNWASPWSALGRRGAARRSV